MKVLLIAIFAAFLLGPAKAEEKEHSCWYFVRDVDHGTYRQESVSVRAADHRKAFSECLKLIRKLERTVKYTRFS